MSAHIPAETDPALDPDWEQFRAETHALVDELVDGLRDVRQRPVWRSVPAETRARLRGPVPEAPQGLSGALADLRRDVLPYPYGTAHPRFWGWVNGSALPIGLLGDLTATAMNSNVGAFDHAAVFVEQEVLRWLSALLGHDAPCDGLLTSGGSMANLLGLATGVNARAGFDVRRRGLSGGPQLTVYASLETHDSVHKALELMGLGRDHLRLVATDADYRVDLDALRAAVRADRDAGLRPVALVGNAGTVSTGATDDLDALADLAHEEGLWFHVDGAFGALAWLVEARRGELRGLQRADSLAFDLHKWLYLSNDVGCLLVREHGALERTFATRAAYLTELEGGLSAYTDGAFKDKGLELTRRFRALKVWLALKEHGAAGFRHAIAANLAQARHLALRIDEEPRLERCAPAPLNVVCYRYRGPDDGRLTGQELDALNRTLLVRLQERGLAVPSHTILGGTFCLRVAITNHRTQLDDIELLVRESIAIGDELIRERGTPVQTGTAGEDRR